ncbi:hypothetical protein B0T24DRAFT_596956 [Lasiosphaeria ovina]|uniref:Uncharacterized protein n=1 Tax=Lasiosphaeria ovina TaxID=92902 RepID=A0AAE0JZY6_9PEZI|nr:hypothetical protein B0T24DRAFT_596956 [Lasiosphaeria ovina]
MLQHDISPGQVIRELCIHLSQELQPTLSACPRKPAHGLASLFENEIPYRRRPALAAEVASGKALTYLSCLISFLINFLISFLISSVIRFLVEDLHSQGKVTEADLDKVIVAIRAKRADVLAKPNWQTNMKYIESLINGRGVSATDAFAPLVVVLDGRH